MRKMFWDLIIVSAPRGIKKNTFTQRLCLFEVLLPPGGKKTTASNSRTASILPL